MAQMQKGFSIALVVLMAGSALAAEPLVLKANKDNFGRSNKRNRNSGACEHLAIAHAPNVRSLIAFSLSSVTNEIVGAEFRFHQHNKMTDPISVVIAPMADTKNNHAWVEGVGNLGVQGTLSRAGDSCYAFGSYPDTPWESASGQPLADLGAGGLWLNPITVLNGLKWEKERWIRVPINDLSLLETIRNSERPSITLGLWGKAGNGIYLISSRNSQWAPELHLQLKEQDKK